MMFEAEMLPIETVSLEVVCELSWPGVVRRVNRLIDILERVNRLLDHVREQSTSYSVFAFCENYSGTDQACAAKTLPVLDGQALLHLHLPAKSYLPAEREPLEARCHKTLVYSTIISTMCSNLRNSYVVENESSDFCDRVCFVQETRSDK